MQHVIIVQRFYDATKLILEAIARVGHPFRCADEGQLILTRNPDHAVGVCRLLPETERVLVIAGSVFDFPEFSGNGKLAPAIKWVRPNATMLIYSTMGYLEKSGRVDGFLPKYSSETPEASADRVAGVILRWAEGAGLEQLEKEFPGFSRQYHRPPARAPEHP